MRSRLRLAKEKKVTRVTVHFVPATGIYQERAKTFEAAFLANHNPLPPTRKNLTHPYSTIRH